MNEISKHFHKRNDKNVENPRRIYPLVTVAADCTVIDDEEFLKNFGDVGIYVDYMSDEAKRELAGYFALLEIQHYNSVNGFMRLSVEEMEAHFKELGVRVKLRHV